MHLGLCTMLKTDSGYSIRYPEAVEREHPVPTSIIGMDDAQIEVMAEMQLATVDNDEWNQEQKAERRAELTERLRAIRQQFSTRKQKVWMIEMREWSVPYDTTTFSIPWTSMRKVLEDADRANTQLMQLIRSGVQFVGPLQPGLLVPGGPNLMG